MITLIRNFIPKKIVIVDVLPKQSNISTGANLSRLKYYRNQIVHNEGSFSNVQFSSYWKDICRVNIEAHLFCEHMTIYFNLHVITSNQFIYLYA